MKKTPKPAAKPKVQKVEAVPQVEKASTEETTQATETEAPKQETANVQEAKTAQTEIKEQKAALKSVVSTESINQEKELKKSLETIVLNVDQSSELLA